MTSGNDLARVGCKYLGTPYSIMDCQAFVERCLADCGVKKDLAGSNAWFRFLKQYGWVGTPTECKEKYGKIPPGAFLFILAHDGKEPAKYQGDGIGNASHIGIYTALSGAEMVWIALQNGDSGAEQWNFGDGAINSSSSRGHVCTSKFAGRAISGGWNMIGTWEAQIDYGNGGGGVKVTYQAKVIGGALNLRKAPSTSADRIDQIPDGTIVTVVEEEPDWCKVVYDGREGYVMSKWLAEAKPEQDEDLVAVPRKTLEGIYDTIGDWLGLRG